MADRIVGEYSIKVDEAVKNLDKLAGRVGKLEDASKKAAKNTESEYSKMTSNLMGQFKNLAGAIGVAFGTQQMISFAREAVNVAAKAEGIERAFRKLNDPNLLNDLRKATRGTVSDIELMQKAVQANNFKLPLDQLAKLFQFATNRAIETGESVDYLVESIVLGISRKSIPIMDNLGISSVRLQQEMAKTGDFAQAAFNIIDEEASSAGIVMDTTAVKLARLQASFGNFTKEVGDGLIVLADFALKLDDINNAAIGGEETLKEYSDKTISAAVAAAKLQAATGEEIGFIKALRIQLFGLTSEEEALIESYEKKNEIVEQSNAATQEQIKNVAYYKALIQQLTDEQENENTTLERNFEINKELAVAREELARLLGKETNEQKKLREQLEAIQKLREYEYELIQSTGLPVAQALSDSLNGLNQLLKEQQDILNNAPEFSKQYKDASNAIDELQKKIKEFSDSQIDESNKYDISATAMGLIPEPKTLEQQLDESLALFNEFSNAVSDIFTGIQTIISATYQRQYDELEAQLEQGLITREQFEEREREIKRKQAASAKDAAIFQAVIATAQAVMQALANTPPPLSYALAGVAGALGAAQIAAIASQPLPQFAEGGFVDEHGQLRGRTHARGGIKIEAEDKEFIVKSKYAVPNAEVLRAINRGDWKKYKVENIIAPTIEQVLKGGFEGMGASYQLNSMFNDKNLLKLGDRNRQAAHEDAKYIVKGITKGLSRRQSRWN